MTKSYSAPSDRTQAERDELATANQKLVWSFAMKYARKRGRGHDDALVNDLAGEGMLGLLNAARLWDPSRASFSTYASWSIRRAISSFLSRDRLVGPAYCEARGVYHWKQRNASPAQVDDAIRRRKSAPRVEWPDEVWDRLFDGLDPTDRRVAEEVIRNGRTLEDVGRELGVSKERVRQRACRVRERIAQKRQLLDEVA
jgi:RNA polymerase sigma factor (sigma-70 family)